MNLPMFTRRSARLAALGLGALLLAGCVMPYSYVQGGYGGGYYTNDGPAPGGYYYNTAPTGYGYYGDGYYGGGYGYGYGVPLGVTIGVSNAWPGYYGYGGYGYYRGDHRSGGHWGGHGGGSHRWNGSGGHHDGGSHGWNGSGGNGWSQPSPTSTPTQGFARPMTRPAPAMHAPGRLGGTTIKHR